MERSLTERIEADPRYRHLKETRLRFGWKLAIAMLAVYYGFILLIAFAPGVLAARIGSGVTTWGIPIGFGVIVFTVILTAVYVRRANNEFDPEIEEIRREAMK